MTITISIPNIVINISNTQNLNLEQMAHTLDELLQLATDQSTKEDSLFAIVNGIKTNLSDALAKLATAGTTDPAAIQAEVDQVFAKFTDNTQKLSQFVDAITANTPTDGSTTPPVVPPVTTPPSGTGDGSTTTPTPDPTPAPVDTTPAPPVVDTPAPVDGTPAPVDSPETPVTPSTPTGPTAPTGPVTNPDGSTVI